MKNCSVSVATHIISHRLAHSRQKIKKNVNKNRHKLSIRDLSIQKRKKVGKKTLFPEKQKMQTWSYWNRQPPRAALEDELWAICKKILNPGTGETVES